jgi:hypothetical protein
MAIIGYGFSNCILCNQLLAKEDDIVATSHFVESPFDFFWRYSDAPFHQSCFSCWSLKTAFIARYNRTAGRRRKHWMGPDGQIVPGLAPAALEADPAPDDEALGDVALVLPSSERRPGINVVVNSLPYPLDQARFLVALQVSVPLDPSHHRILDRVRVGPIEHVASVVSTGEHALPLSLLSEAPADIGRAGGMIGAGVHCLEVHGHGPNQALLSPRAVYAICLMEGLRVTDLSCWAVRRR